MQSKKTKYPQISSERDKCYRGVVNDKDRNMAVNLGTNIIIGQQMVVLGTSFRV